MKEDLSVCGDRVDWRFVAFVSMEARGLAESSEGVFSRSSFFQILWINRQRTPKNREVAFLILLHNETLSSATFTLFQPTKR